MGEKSPENKEKAASERPVRDRNVSEKTTRALGSAALNGGK